MHVCKCVSISLTEANYGTIQKCPFGVNTTIQLNNLTNYI